MPYCTPRAGLSNMQMIYISFSFFVLLLFRGATYAQPTNNRMQFELLKTVELKGQEYPLDLLPIFDQGSASDAYQITKPFEGHSAILKVVRETSKTEKEVEYLKRVRLFLYAEASKMVTGAYYIVLLDLYPTYQPLYAWYMAGKVTNLDADIVKMQQAVKTHLMLAATKRGLLYYDFHFNNVFINENFDVAAAIDWGPPADGKTGVIPITEEKGTAEYKSRLERYEAKLEEIPGEFSIDKLDKELRKRGSKL